MDKNLNYERLSFLGDKVKLGDASKAEKDEFMYMLYQNKNINEKHYSQYKANRNIDEIVNAALAVGAVVLLGYLIGELIKSE
tara:strand:- start:8158 stop:8403 length:246 start_codon:yes stop_codon:yes gene_type:complete